MTVSNASRPVNQSHSSSLSSSSSSSSNPRRSRTSNGVVSRTAANYGPFPPPTGPTALNRYGAPGAYGNMATYGSYPPGYPRYPGGNLFGSGGAAPPPAGFGGLYGPYNNNHPLGLGGGPYQPDPNDPNSLTNSLGHSTRATFQIIESIVTAVGGFAQMLESTYMATHTSFFGGSSLSLSLFMISMMMLMSMSMTVAMVSVAEQFGNLRNTLGSIFGIFALIRWFKSSLNHLGGRHRHRRDGQDSLRPSSVSAGELTPSNFAWFEDSHHRHHHSSSASTSGPGAGVGVGTGATGSRPYKKPLLIFIITVFGIPWLMGRFIRTMTRSHHHHPNDHLQRLQQQQQHQQQILLQQQEQRQQYHEQYQEQQQQQQQQQQQVRQGLIQSAETNQVDFCRVLYDFNPQTIIDSSILNKSDGMNTNPNPMTTTTTTTTTTTMAMMKTAGLDLAVKKGDLVAVLSRVDPATGPSSSSSSSSSSEWWRCRARDGRVGYLPAPYLELLGRRELLRSVDLNTITTTTTTGSSGSSDGSSLNGTVVVGGGGGGSSSSDGDLTAISPRPRPTTTTTTTTSSSSSSTNNSANANTTATTTNNTITPTTIPTTTTTTTPAPTIITSTPTITTPTPNPSATTTTTTTATTTTKKDEKERGIH